MNNIWNLELKGVLQLYADDAVLIYSCDTIKQLFECMNHDIKLIHDWFTVNKMSMNLCKTKYIVYQPHQRAIDLNGFELQLLNTTIERVSNFKYLGLQIDSALNFKNHVDFVAKKISPYVAVIQRLNYTLHDATKKSIYYAYINSHLQYMNSVWSNCSSTHSTKLVVLQNKSVRAIFSEQYNPQANVHTIDLYKNNNILNYLNMCNYEGILLIYKIENNLIKNLISFKKNDQIHSYGTRNRDKFYLPKINNDYGKNSMDYKWVKMFNTIPNELKQINSLNLFKFELKRYLLNK